MVQQQSAAIMFEKSNDGNIDKLSKKLQNATSTNEKLEENVKGLEEKLSIAEEEKLQLRKVRMMLKVVFLLITEHIHNLHHTSIMLCRCCEKCGKYSHKRLVNDYDVILA